MARERDEARPEDPEATSAHPPPGVDPVERSEPVDEEEEVDEWGYESFPASDPPPVGGS
jgi:hypothetical protein